MVRVGKLEATSEEVKALHLDALSEAWMHADEGVASAAGAGLFNQSQVVEWWLYSTCRHSVSCTPGRHPAWAVCRGGF